MTFTDTHSTVRRQDAPPVARAAVSNDRYRWAGGKLPNEDERAMVEARRARKRAA